MTPLARIRLLLLPILLAALGLAAWYREPPPPSLAGVGVLMVFDITQSMQVEDVQVAGRAVSRLSLAKRAALRAIESLPCGVSVGAGVFTAHRSVLLYSPVEICANRAEIVQSIGLVDTSMAWGGNSEVAKGYFGSLAVARALPNRPALVFLTDGHEAPPINPQHRPTFQGKAGEVRATLVGIGGALPVPIPKRDPTGRALGYWNAEEVMQIDPYRTPRTSGSPDMLVQSERATEDDLRAAGTPGTEHLSSLRTDYLQLLAAETDATYRTVRSEEQLPEVVNSLLSISLKAAPLPTRQVAMFIALAAAAAFYCLAFLPWHRLRLSKPPPPRAV
ncbi:MAG: VWA domain-containing protein [Lautropia sp.]|nr:VWA domain-containing protein [Lautropia sp.]